LDLLLQAVVSIYLYMARSTRLSGNEINVIDRILRYLFGNDIPLYLIEQARLHTLPLREAANLLNLHLSHGDKLKLILNLIALAYRDPDKLHVLSNVEIVELTDLLRVDVNILDPFFDVAEGLADSLSLPVSSFLEKQNHLLKGSMIWGSGNCDLPLGANDGQPLIFIMIENLALFCLTATDIELSSEQSYLQDLASGNRKHLIPNLFYVLSPNQELNLVDGDKTLKLELEDIWTLYKMPSGACHIPLHNTLGERRSLCLESGDLWLKPLVGRPKQIKKLALDDIVPELGSQEPLARLITRRDTASRQTQLTSELWLQRQDDRHRLIDSQEGDCLISLSREADHWWLSTLDSTPVFLNREKVKERREFSINNDVITVDNLNYLINRDLELIEIPIDIRELLVSEVYHEFTPDRKIALDGISFNLKQGNMMAIMGPSGSGKTTLLKVLLGELEPRRCQIEIDGMDLGRHYSFFRKFIGYVPQDDLLFANLSVYENIYFNLRLRMPQIRDVVQIRSRIDNLLKRVGLFEQRDMIVGDVMHKKLSGGQRRRLNIALELISNPMIIILDEPTSGLSSKDSENITQFLRELKEQGKIILCTIHQPNATILNQFDRVLLMDRNGTQVWFGDTDTVFDYFDEELANSDPEKEKLKEKKRLRMPEYFYDLIELQEEDSERRFSPSHWKQKWRDHRFREALIEDSQVQESSEVHPFSAIKEKPGSGARNLILLLRRNLINKLRSRLNLIMTLGVSPLLAFLTALILRSASGTEAYSFGANQNFPLFCFISVIIFIFIGLANSVDDILGEKRVIIREKNLNIGVLPLIGSKNLVLFIMTLAQSLLYYQISVWVLGIKGSFWPFLLSLQLSGILGYKMGLLSSSLIQDRSAIINVLPLILIPQIMFSGAVISFQDMNSALRLNKDREVPEFCQLIPSRWLFETALLSQEKLNARSRTFERFRDRLADLNDPSYFENVELFNKLLAIRSEDTHSNRLAQNMIRMAHGRYVQSGRNVFLSHTSHVFGYKLPTLWLDLAALMIMIMALNLGLWIRLRYFFR